ncbi:MAG TPA: PQQ-binding-like beta-propeller repeat protein [Solirubrobacteraceae bacterium]|nr:PQQ-binding-like beta-propeller repeat protein [Solirubrobacteraceae bacterium]
MKSGARTCLLVLGALLAVWAAPARADWTTYHADAGRSGVDQSSASTPLPFAAEWTSPNLGANVYAEPLVYHGLVIVATEGNDVYALNETTGQVVWHMSAGTPVPSGKLPCGDITPTVGITSTPVVDPATGTLYVVADQWDGSHAHHTLIAYSATTGAQLFTKNVDPAGAIPENQLQRPALNLSGGHVLIGFGGNDGDCASYWGWLVSVAEDGSSTSAWQALTDKGDAIWGSSGPAVDGAGAVYVATGNGSSTYNGSSAFDYGDSVLKFASAAAVAPGSPSDYFAPADWMSLNSGDADLGSSGPVLLPGNLAFQDGKGSTGYLLSTASLGHLGGQLYQASTGCASFGGDAYANGIIYVACASGGTLALALNTTSPGHPTFSQLWRGPADANGSPIIAGGRVWVPSFSDGVLYGLDPQTGAVDVKQSTPAMEHFTSPAASDGRLLLATGPTVEAYTVAAAVANQTLTVTEAGTGAGAVQGDKAPTLVCPGACSQTYPSGTAVTLTEAPASRSAFAGWSGGGCSGTASTCTVTLSADVHVIATFTSTEGKPTVSGASLSGVARGKAKLTFTVHAGSRAPALRSIVVSLPAGLSFERKGLGRGLTVTGANGKRARFTTKLGHGVLTIALRSAQRSVRIALHGRALSVSRKLAREARHKPRRTLRFVVKATDADGSTTRLPLKLRA